MCKKFDDSTFSYSWGIFKALKFKVDHVTWTHEFQGQLVVSKLGLAMINRHTEFEMPTITCNVDMKGNAKIRATVWRLKGNAQGSSMAR